MLRFQACTCSTIELCSRTYLCSEKTMLDLEFQLGVKEVDVLEPWPDPNILKKSIGFSETLKSILV